MRSSQHRCTSSCWRMGRWGLYCQVQTAHYKPTVFSACIEFTVGKWRKRTHPSMQTKPPFFNVVLMNPIVWKMVQCKNSRGETPHSWYKLQQIMGSGATSCRDILENTCIFPSFSLFKILNMAGAFQHHSLIWRPLEQHILPELVHSLYMLSIST